MNDSGGLWFGAGGGGDGAGAGGSNRRNLSLIVSSDSVNNTSNPSVNSTMQCLGSSNTALKEPFSFCHNPTQSEPHPRTCIIKHGELNTEI